MLSPTCVMAKAYTVTAKSRLASAPDVPTVDEAGLPHFYISVWSAMWAPKGTPHDVIDKLNAAITTALRDEAVRQRLARSWPRGSATRPAGPRGPCRPPEG